MEQFWTCVVSQWTTVKETSGARHHLRYAPERLNYYNLKSVGKMKDGKRTILGERGRERESAQSAGLIGSGVVLTHVWRSAMIQSQSPRYYLLVHFNYLTARVLEIKVRHYNICLSTRSRCRRYGLKISHENKKKSDSKNSNVITTRSSRFSFLLPW